MKDDLGWGYGAFRELAYARLIGMLMSV
jgi:hypothetical protein